MNRRSFLATAAGMALLAGCGSGSSDSGFGSGGSGNPAAPASQQVSGRIEPELVIGGSEIGSAYGPSTIAGNTFTTSISSTTVGLLAMGDSTGVRGFALTLPGETPVFSAENSALAIIFMEPGFLRLDPTAAKELIARIRASSAFAAFVQILLANAQTRRLDLLSGDANFVAARDALVQSLGNPFTASNPTGRVESPGRGTISNPSPRFLQVLSDDNPAPRLLAPFGTLSNASTKSNYTFHGLGPASTLPGNTSLIESTYFPTLFFAVFLPWLELAVGQKIPVELGLSIVSRLRAQPLEPHLDLVSTTNLATSMAADATLTIGEMAESITQSFTDLTKLITGLSYLGGLAFSIGAILKFKQHKDNPTQYPIGTEALVFIAAVLLFLPSILNKLGKSMFDDPAGSPTEPVGGVFN